jgi:hypothetical protein
MTGFAHFPGSAATTGARAHHRARAAVLAGAALLAGASLLAVGCSTGSSDSTASSPARNGAAAGTGAVAGPGTGSSSAGHAAPAAPGVKARLATLPAPGGPSIIYTATLTVRSKDVTSAASQAARAAQDAGGYVSSERASAGTGHRARASVFIQLKVPAAAYPATLAAVSKLGVRLSQTQQAQDVTQAVADVSSRVTSAQQAITQLRKLLTRAGSVSGLLSVQQEINGEESSLEALQAQQRALARETTYATISLHLVSQPAAAVRHHHHRAAGFTGGLLAGWRALRTVGGGLLTAAGAVLPFVIPLALLAAAFWYGRRWWARHRAGATPAEASPGE